MRCDVVGGTAYVARMTSEVWGPLVGAVIGALAAIGAMVVQAWLQAREAARRDESIAIEEVLVRSSAVVLRSHELAVVVPAVASLDGLFARLIGVMVPLDYGRLLGPLHAETIELERAVARVRLASDPATIALAEKVVDAAMTVLKELGAPDAGRLHRRVLVLFHGRRPFDAGEVRLATNALAERRQELIELVRQTRGR